MPGSSGTKPADRVRRRRCLSTGLQDTMAELRYPSGPGALSVSYVWADDDVVVRVDRAATTTWWRNIPAPPNISEVEL